MPTPETSKLSAVISCSSCSFSKRISVTKYRPGTKLKCPECRTRFYYELKLAFDDRVYGDISPDAFMHPLDKKAISAVRRVPGIDFAIRKMMEFGYEKIIRVNAMADDVKVTPKTCGYIHDMAEQAAKSLGVALPDVYINQDPVPNAWTIGTEFPMITIQSGLIELLNEDELYAVIAHEMGHIKCLHVLYHMLADFLSTVASNIGVAGYIIIPLNLALLEWSRKSELSADRASLLVTNNKDSVIKLLMKLAGGSRHLSKLIDEDEFVTQAAQFEKLTEGVGLNKFYRVVSNITRTHPFPVLRGFEVNKWAAGEEYSRICNGDYERRSQESVEPEEERACNHCGESLTLADVQCPSCGQSVERLADQYDGGGAQEFVSAAKKGFDYVKGFFGSEDERPPEVLGAKMCPTCGQIFPESTARFCPHDGTPLMEVADDQADFDA